MQSAVCPLAAPAWVPVHSEEQVRTQGAWAWGLLSSPGGCGGLAFLSPLGLVMVKVVVATASGWERAHSTQRVSHKR